MDGIEFQYSMILPALASLILVWCISRWHRKPKGSTNPPPSPPKLPVIGNLHQLGSCPHRNLHFLAKKHGPLMLLRLGRIPTLIVSTADTAREIIKTHDLTFSDRPLYKAHKRVIYISKGLIFGPYGEFWRQMKSMFVLKLLGSKRVQSARRIMEEETSLLVKRIGESSSPVNLSEVFSQFGSDVVCRSAFGGKYSESEDGKKFVTLVAELSEVMGAGVGVGDFVPWLGWIDRVSGFDVKVDRVAKGLNNMLESVIEDRLQNRTLQSSQDNFLDILLQIYMDNTSDVSLEKDCIKGLLLDVFAAGGDSTSITVEWAMAELLRHHKMMDKLQTEVRGIVGHKHDITDQDLDKMHYLKAVIKETFRLHPPVPLQLRVAREDVNVRGYDVAAGTVVMINVWTISRDPASWAEPEKFEPERFLNSSVDVKGQDFELIPFGAGRRGCPGIGYSMLLIELLIANLVQKFNWEMPDGKHMDMSERLGVTVRRATPLLAVATRST